MGYRETLISLDYSTKLPNWFTEKYKSNFLFSGMLTSTKFESKMINTIFFEDYQKAVLETDFWDHCNIIMTFVILGEDRVITKVLMSKDEIKYVEMLDGEGKNK